MNKQKYKKNIVFVHVPCYCKLLSLIDIYNKQHARHILHSDLLWFSRRFIHIEGRENFATVTERTPELLLFLFVLLVSVQYVYQKKIAFILVLVTFSCQPYSVPSKTCK